MILCVKFEKANLMLLGISETKKKGKGCITLEAGHLFM